LVAIPNQVKALKTFLGEAALVSSEKYNSKEESPSLSEESRKSFTCPKCGKAIEVPFIKHGPWEVYYPKVKCSDCRKDISTSFFVYLTESGTRFKRSKNIGKKSFWNASGTQEIVNVEDESLTFEQALKVLTPKQAAFVLEYVKDFNGTRAAVRAGYPPKNARIIASQNLTLLNISRALRAFFRTKRVESKKTVDDIEKKLEQIVFTNITDIIGWTRDGVTFAKDSDNLPEAAKAAVKNMKFTENMSGISVEVEMADRIRALKLLGMQKGMFNKKVQVIAKGETYAEWRRRVGMSQPK